MTKIHTFKHWICFSNFDIEFITKFTCVLVASVSALLYVVIFITYTTFYIVIGRFLARTLCKSRSGVGQAHVIVMQYLWEELKNDIFFN